MMFNRHNPPFNATITLPQKGEGRKAFEITGGLQSLFSTHLVTRVLRGSVTLYVVKTYKGESGSDSRFPLFGSLQRALGAFFLGFNFVKVLFPEPFGPAKTKTIGLDIFSCAIDVF